MPDLKQILADQPDDYTYFNKQFLGSWAGPQFWKKRNLWHMVQKRKPKEVPVVKRERRQYKPRDFRNELSSSGKVVPEIDIKLKLATLEKWKGNELLLPEDYHYDLKKLLRPFQMPDSYYSCVTGKRDRKKPRDDDVDNMSDDSMDAHDPGFDPETEDFAFPSQPPPSQVIVYVVSSISILCSLAAVRVAAAWRNWHLHWRQPDRAAVHGRPNCHPIRKIRKENRRQIAQDDRVRPDRQGHESGRGK